MGPFFFLYTSSLALLLVSAVNPSEALLTELFEKIRNKLTGNSGGGSSSSDDISSAFGQFSQMMNPRGEQQGNNYGAGDPLGQQFGQIGQSEQKYGHYGQQSFGQQQMPEQQQESFGAFSPQNNGQQQSEGHKGVFSKMFSWMKNKALDLMSKGTFFDGGSSSKEE